VSKTDRIFCKCISTYVHQAKISRQWTQFPNGGKFRSKSHSHPLAPVLTHADETDEVLSLLNFSRVLSVILEGSTSPCDFSYEDDWFVSEYNIHQYTPDQPFSVFLTLR